MVQSHANYRSKDAIRARRQQQEYKAILRDLIQKQDDTNASSDDNDSSTDSDSPSIPATTCNDMNAIHKLLNDIAIAGHIKLSDHMKNAIDAFLNPNF